ncbi:hypothetical protein COV81_03115 [Candidatus Peregrinibacteria bacterium CG11_big_fil_rev_8_21_14_0_20_41_10]|nr:MAG: hypothetical protein COV81_03115 [Candidatus Peregrinibacteria bacterium CG11_big_fil_rev_8_21_14_0_20_41_10]PIZ74941.1 MAG: hypothetical protein COY06_03445 [Candidatus Peregrinibacteria bacterium CG_4_10_14_0_2_um_filter_41_8]PJC37948.1 MAG: hypothetical protein CO045_02810 [Candidatus Peregrinibacteria bacterium CG_4_9_14_0_2_um_filter_41_14]
MDAEIKKQKDEVAPGNVIYVEIDEEVTSVFEKIKQKNVKQLYLSIPKRSVLFQSLINIKILKRKVSEIDKEIIFITTDDTGAYFANQVGLPVYKNLRLEKFDYATPSGVNESSIDDVVRFAKERPLKRDERKKSISDIKQGLQKASFDGMISSLQDKWRQYRKTKQRRLLMENPHKQAVFGLIAGGVALLLMIVYVALPHATIYITPNKQVIEQSINVTLAETHKNEGLLSKRPRRVLGAYEIAPPELTQTITYKTAGKIFEGTNARGQITVINEANREWTFIPRTQFQTDDGLVFRAVDYVKVPPKGADGPGRVVIDVVADEFDTAGHPIGDRGNIGPTKLKVAKLAAGSQTMVYAESTELMTGGTTITRTQVTEEDYNNALELAKKQLVEKVPALLEEQLKQNVELSNSGLKLLTVSGGIKIEEPEAFADKSVIGTSAEEFTVTAKVKARGFAFNESEMLVILKNELLLRESPDKQISQVSNESISYRIFSQNDDAGIYELTATIKGVEAFDLDPNKQAGINLVKKIKDHILGQRIVDATAYMENLPEIEKVEVKRWPFWAPSLPSLNENVKIVVDNVEALAEVENLGQANLLK